MGGCASKPKDLDRMVPAPVPAPIPVEKPEPEAENVVHESNGGETKNEEPLIDLSETAQEAPKKEETTVESKPVEHIPSEETKHEEAVKVPTAPAAPAAAAATAETEKKPEEVAEEAAAAPVITNKPTEAQKSDDKSDAPLVTV